MRKRMTLIMQSLVGLVVAIGIVIIGIYPHRPNGPLGWVVLTAAAIPVVLGLQYLGTRGLENRFMSGLGKTGRILLGLFVVVGIGAFVLVLWQLVLPGMGTW